MPSQRVTVGTVIRLLLASLAVGFVLALLDVTPGDLLASAARGVGAAWDLVRGAFGWAGSYILLGAIVVVPVWLVGFLWGRRRDD